MITRRAFLTALASLPLVGRWMPKTEPIYLTMEPPSAAWYNAGLKPVLFDPESGISVRFVDKWDVTPDPAPNRCDGYMCEDGQIRFMLSRDGGKTWKPNGALVNVEDLPRYDKLAAKQWEDDYNAAYQCNIAHRS